MDGERILVVDDDADVRTLVRTLLERDGAVVREAVDGRDALRLLYDVRPDLVVLDVSMPDLDGWQTLERIRDLSEVPVLMLTARDNELEKVRGLQAGADDYVTKPFGRQELLARCGALLRRAKKGGDGNGSGAGAPLAETYDDGLVRIDPQRAEVRIGETQVQLTPLEFRLLHTLVRHKDQVLNREQLLDLVWGDLSTVAPDQVKLYIGYVRRKVTAALPPGIEDPIETVRGFGYRYRAPA